MATSDIEILVLYHSPGGTTREMANVIARGVRMIDGVDARLRTVADIHDDSVDAHALPESGDLLVSKQDLLDCAGLAMGCPTHFGNMTAAMKHFIDSTSDIWMGGRLAGKPATVFSASTSMHGGQESTLLTMMLPLLHHGMLIAGLPYTETALFSTRSGGSPYGATRLTDNIADHPLTDEEQELCLATGKRIADLSARLARD